MLWYQHDQSVQQHFSDDAHDPTLHVNNVYVVLDHYVTVDITYPCVLLSTVYPVLTRLIDTRLMDIDCTSE